MNSLLLLPVNPNSFNHNNSTFHGSSRPDVQSARNDADAGGTTADSIEYATTTARAKLSISNSRPHRPGHVWVWDSTQPSNDAGREK
jgi:hypothetical protein